MTRRTLITSLFLGYCPKCRQARLFVKKACTFRLKTNLAMYKQCPFCGQKSEPEVGFYYGTGYVSYAISIAISILTFVASWIWGGLPFAYKDVLLLWMVVNSFLLILIQPCIMRFSRILWLYFFVR